MHELANRLLKSIRKKGLLSPGDRVAAAVSGGADSVALLFLLEELRAELGIVLSVAHVNHKLRGAESDEDERFVAQLAARLGLKFTAGNAPIEHRARRPARLNSSIEAAARNLRYEFFRGLAQRGGVTKIATAHALDDQAETVLLRIFRGTGIRGLAGIHPRLFLEHGHADGGMGALARAGPKSAVKREGRGIAAEVVRPLLGFRHAELREYLRERHEGWREDLSNTDESFLRNRVRQRLLPLIAEEFGDASIVHMAELAEIARAEEEYWTDAAGGLPGATSPAAALELENLRARPLAVQRRQVRAWLDAHAPDVAISFSLIEEILELVRGPAGKKLALPGGASARSVRRSRDDLVLECATGAQQDYEYTMSVPGAVSVPELSARIEARIVEVGAVPEDEQDNLLDPARVGGTLTIRNWQAADRYWPAHTAREKKVKELLADLHATGPRKKLWPVAVNEVGSLVWMRGFAAPASFQPRSTKAIWISGIVTKP